MKTQLCLLSGELMPNVIGVLHTRPDRVLPVVTRETLGQVQALAAALRAADASTLLLDPVSVLPWDLADCLKTLRQQMQTRGETRVEINWTGGTKIMSYAARRLAEELRLPALYVNTAEHQVLVEEAATGDPCPEMIDSARLGLNSLVHILAAGHTVEGAESLDSFRARCTPAPELVRAATRILDACRRERGEVLKLAEARNIPYTPTHLPESFVQTLIQARLIQPGRRPGEFFLSPETLLHPFHLQSALDQNASFLKSTYLEVFLWSQLKERAGFDDVAWHVVLNPGQRGRMAELDVVASSEGRFLVLECKSSVDLARLSDIIEEQYARTRKIGRLFGRWILYVHRHRADYPEPNAATIIASQEAKSQDYGGRLLWQDELTDLPVIAATFLNESKPTL